MTEEDLDATTNRRLKWLWCECEQSGSRCTNCGVQGANKAVPIPLTELIEALNNR